MKSDRLFLSRVSSDEENLCTGIFAEVRYLGGKLGPIWFFAIKNASIASYHYVKAFFRKSVKTFY